MIMQSVKRMIEEMLGDISYSKDSNSGRLFPFMCRVGCVKKRPPRHSYFEHILEMGRIDVERVLKNKFINKDVLTFIFPERWMSVHEQQQFMALMSQHKDRDKLKQVDIITSAPLIIGSFHREQIKILEWDDD